jgi:hypothetical protein
MYIKVKFDKQSTDTTINCLVFFCYLSVLKIIIIWWKKYINVREYRRCKYKWTIHSNSLTDNNRVHQTKKNKTVLFLFHIELSIVSRCHSFASWMFTNINLVCGRHILWTRVCVSLVQHKKWIIDRSKREICQP